jgi:hypothetical protein
MHISGKNRLGKGAAIAAEMAGRRKVKRMTELSEADWSRLGAARSRAVYGEA